MFSLTSKIFNYYHDYIFCSVLFSTNVNILDFSYLLLSLLSIQKGKEEKYCIMTEEKCTVTHMSHHVQQKLCRTRPLYRQGKKLTAVKVVLETCILLKSNFYFTYLQLRLIYHLISLPITILSIYYLIILKKYIIL